MVDEQREVPGDEISRRMGEVIDDVEAVHSQRVTPHWEVFEDEDGGKPRIYHLHDDQRVEASIVDGGCYLGRTLRSGWRDPLTWALPRPTLGAEMRPSG